MWHRAILLSLPFVVAVEGAAPPARRREADYSDAFFAALGLVNFGECGTGPEYSPALSACEEAREDAGGGACVFDSSCGQGECYWTSCECTGTFGGDYCTQDMADGSADCGFTPSTDQPACQGIDATSLLGGTCRITPCAADNSVCDSINDR